MIAPQSARMGYSFSRELVEYRLEIEHSQAAPDHQADAGDD
jgi:hypothetical protein